MAKITVPNLEKYEHQLAELGAHAEGVCKYAVYDAAAMVADSVKQNCPVGKGAEHLRDSIVLIPFQNEDGYVYTKVDFVGYDEKGTPQRLKARVLESGRSGPKGITGKHAFVRKAVDKVKKAAEFSIEMNLEKQLKKYFK